MNSITTIRHGAYRDVANNTAGGSTYEHPTFDPHRLGLYKVAVTHEGHVNQVEYVSADDIIPLGIQGELTAGVNITIDSENVISADDMQYDDTDIVAAIEAEANARATADANLQSQIDSIEVGGGASVNTLIYLGHLNIDEPTTNQLTTFAQSQAQTLFNNGDLKTGYTVRDAQDRDWRWVDDGDSPPPPPVKSITVGNQNGTVIVGNNNQTVTFSVTTMNIANGSYTPVLSAALTGVSVSGNITINNNSGTLTLAIANNAGVGTNARSISFDSTTSNNFNITVTAGVISFTTQPAQTTNVTEGAINQTLTAAASSTSTTSSMAYQWYINASNSNNGGTTVGGATGATFSITTTLSPGTYYFYCVASGNKGETPAASNVATVVVAAAVVQPPDNRMYDPVDDRYYDVIDSGGLYWTVENFARTSAGVFYSGSEPFPQAGKLYTYAEAVSNAPQGWRLPTEAEIRSLQTAAGSTNGMKATTQWQTANGTNTIGFALLPAGYNNGSFSYVNQRASLWLGNSSGYRFYILYSSDTLNFNTDAAYLCSIRYVKEAI
jgi:uncharacterized protein (TIGR02145 family)